jgi:hypothetical protein
MELVVMGLETHWQQGYFRMIAKVCNLYVTVAFCRRHYKCTHILNIQAFHSFVDIRCFRHGREIKTYIEQLNNQYSGIDSHGSYICEW